MEGWGLAIQNSIRTPDEVREKENLPRMGGEAAKLHIQGATVPLGSQNMQGAVQPTNDNNIEGEAQAA